MGDWSYQDPGYDTLKRLVGGTAATGPYYGQYACWQYDAFGNRTSEAVSATPCSQSPVPTSWAHYNTNNQISATGLMLSGYLYDAAGNVLNDGVNQYLYDGEDRICAVKSDTTGALTGYIYDASGARVGKGTLQTFSCNLSSNGFAVTSGYVVGPNGEQLTETDGGTGWLHTHVFANGQLLATYSSSDTLFELSDWLGTRRADVGVSGCETTWQSLPYGDGLTSSGNCSDTSELHFTGKERNEESGNDYFPARYYGSPLGRWMSPDHYMGSYDPSNPQSFNRYSYVLNDPLVYTDPTGQFALCGVTTALGIMATGGPVGPVASGVMCGISIAAAAIDDIFKIAGLFGSGFHGSLKPRPNSQLWPEYNPGYGPNIAAALGLPDEQCDFGVCDGGANGFGAGQTDQNGTQVNNGPQYPYIPWSPQARNAQGRNPGPKTPRYIPREDPGPEPRLGPFNEPPPTNSGRFWYSLMQILRIIHVNNFDIFPVIVDPCALPPVGPSDAQLPCHRPAPIG